MPEQLSVTKYAHTIRQLHSPLFSSSQHLTLTCIELSIIGLYFGNSVGTISPVHYCGAFYFVYIFVNISPFQDFAVGMLLCVKKCEEF